MRTALCLALAGLSAHTPPQQWGHPDGALGALTARLGGEPKDRALPCLLQLLVVLPQEAGSHRPAIRPERRRAYAAELLAAAPGALTLLAQLHAARMEASRPDEIESTALEAFASWVWLACNSAHASGMSTWQNSSGGRNLPPGCDPASLAQHPLTAAALAGLAQPHTFDAAVETVVELIRAAAPRSGAVSGDGDAGGDGMPPPVSQPGAAMDPASAPLVNVLVPAIMALRPGFADADDDTAKGCARLFAEVGEAFMELIASATPEAAAPVDALLAVANHPDDDVASVSYEFWWRLACRLLDTPGVGPDGSAPADGAQQQQEMARRLAAFAPAFSQFVRAAAHRVKYPEDFGQWKREDRLAFRKDRSTVGDALLQSARVLGGDKALSILSEPLAALAAASHSPQSFDWRTAEASLYCCRSVARAAPPPDNALLSQLLSALHTLPAISEVQYTACMTAGGYADWISAAIASGNPHAQGLLHNVLNLLTSALSAGGDAPGGAAHALRSVCDSCAGHLVPLMPQLLDVYARVMAADADTATAATTGAVSTSPLGLEPEDIVDITSGLAHLLSAIPSAEQQRSALDALLAPPVGALEALLSQTAAGSTTPPPPAFLTRYFDRIAAVMRYCGCPAAAAGVLCTRLWPLIAAALMASADEAACDRVCRTLKYALRNAGAPRCGAILAPACELLRQLFHARRHACLLFAASELVREFAGDPAAIPHLTQLLSSLFADAAHALPTLSAFHTAPDVADDTFLMAERALKVMPASVFEPQALRALLAMATTGACVQHREACQSLLLFTGRLLRCRQPDQLAALSQAVPPTGEALTRALLTAALVALPPARIPDVADALHALLSLGQEAALGWVQATLSRLPETAAPQQDVASLARVCAGVATPGRVSATGGVIVPVRSLCEALDEMAQVTRRNRHAYEAAYAALTGEQMLPPPPPRVA